MSIVHGLPVSLCVIVYGIILLSSILVRNKLLALRKD